MTIESDCAIVVFDGVCNFCNASVSFIFDRDPAGYFKFAAAQSDVGARILAERGVASDAARSVVLIEGEKTYLRSAAALRIARHLVAPWPALAALAIVPAPIRDAAYDFLARHRYAWFGRRESCRISAPALRQRFLTGVSSRPLGSYRR